MTHDPHAGAQIVRAGPTGRTAKRAVIAIHGRGADPSDMVRLIEAVGAVDVAVFAPAAQEGRSWWPTSFLAPYATLEPYLLSALSVVERAFAAAREEGFAAQEVVLMGFSQGGCLALEAVARRGGPVRAVLGLSGGLLGTGDAEGPASEALYGATPKRFDYDSDLRGIPVHIGCHERDPHIPLARVRESAAVLEALGAKVDTAIYPGAGHALGDADVSALRAALQG